MTFSIVGQVGDAYGVAVASRFIAVGAVVPAARIGVGACATQALDRVSYKQDSLDELAAGHTADEAVRRVTSADADAPHRQLGVVGAQTQASHTGAECRPWAGGVSVRDPGEHPRRAPGGRPHAGGVAAWCRAAAPPPPGPGDPRRGRCRWGLPGPAGG